MTERNANHIIPSCSHFSVRYRSLVDQCGSRGSCNPQIYFIFILFILFMYSNDKSLTIRMEYRLRIFENRILRRITGAKRDENGFWSRLHNEELLSS